MMVMRKSEQARNPVDAGRRQTNIFAVLDDVLHSAGTPRPLYQGNLSQQRMDAMDSHARACPSAASRSIPELAKYLASAARGPEERVRAICFWLHLNVRYDTKAFFSGNVRSMSAEDVLQDRSSVCHGFARLMAALCKACDITCEIIEGYAKGVSYDKDVLRPDGPQYRANHNWNAVQLYSPTKRSYCWYLVDPTWAAGHCNGTDWVQQWAPQFYMPDPIALAQSHFSPDASWTLLPEEQRPTWRAFSMAPHVRFPHGWDLGIMPVSHRRKVLPVPDDERLRVVFKAKRGAHMFAKVGQRSDRIRPSTLPLRDGSGSELLAFDFHNIKAHCWAPTTSIMFFASQERYSTYTGVIEYVLVRS